MVDLGDYVPWDGGGKVGGRWLFSEGAFFFLGFWTNGGREKRRGIYWKKEILEGFGRFWRFCSVWVVG